MSDRLMSCAQVARALDVADVDAPLDGAALSEHLDACPACAAEHPDVVWLLASKTTAPDGPLPKVSWPAEVPKIAAVALVTAGLLFAFGPDRTPDPIDRRPIPVTDPGAAGRHDEDAAPLRFLPTELQSARPATVVTVRGDDEPISTFSRSVWTPPRPRCLDPEKP